MYAYRTCNVHFLLSIKSELEIINLNYSTWSPQHPHCGNKISNNFYNIGRLKHSKSFGLASPNLPFLFSFMLLDIPSQNTLDAFAISLALGHSLAWPCLPPPPHHPTHTAQSTKHMIHLLVHLWNPILSMKPALELAVLGILSCILLCSILEEIKVQSSLVEW